MTPDELAKRFPYVIQATVAWDHDTLQAHRHHVGDMSLPRLDDAQRDGPQGARGVHQGAGVHGDPRRGEPAGRGPGRRPGRARPQRHDDHRAVRRARPHARPDPDRPAAVRGQADRHRRRGLLQDLPQVRQQLPDEQHHLRRQDRLQRHREVQDQLADLLQDPPVRRRSLRQLPDLRRGLPVHQAGRLVAAGRRQAAEHARRSRPARRSSAR